MVRAIPPDMVLRLVEDPEFRYEDFAPRGEQAPPTMRAQVWRKCVQVHIDVVFNCLFPHCCVIVYKLKGLQLSQVLL